MLIWCSRNISYYQCWKQLIYLIFLCKLCYSLFQNWWIQSSKHKHFIWYINFNVKQLYCGFNTFNASLNKSNHYFKHNLIALNGHGIPFLNTFKCSPQIYHCFYGSHEIRRLSSNQEGVIRLGQFYDSHMSKKRIFSCSFDVRVYVMWVCPLRFYSRVVTVRQFVRIFPLFLTFLFF